MKPNNALTDTAVEEARPGGKSYRIHDGGGLYLEVTPIGSKLWRMKYRFDGRDRLLAFGAYPAVSLANARKRRDEACKLRAKGIDPAEVRKAQKAAARERKGDNTFKAAAADWFFAWKWTVGEKTAENVWNRLEKDVFPWLGGLPAEDVNAARIQDVLRRMEARGVRDTVRRVKGYISNILNHAIAQKREAFSPARALAMALRRRDTRRHAALTDPAAVAGLLRAIDDFRGTFPIKCALRLAPLVFVRPGELKNAMWRDIDLEAGEWRFFLTQPREEHVVPLARQAVAILRELQPLTGQYDFVFPGRNPAFSITVTTLNAALTRMGYNTKAGMSAHGFRAMARTLFVEKLRMTPGWIDSQLSHVVPDSLEACNRTKFIENRRAMMQAWADYLDRLKNDADVAPTRPAA
ncbi:MAG: integrase arm-type DNA-binding domain-containing protein [Candidatus Accumulibacter sp.]|jgi:integrase|nr:integrase arm-type DNA-binding domain-containing protein [Accumulibacter sp.]